MYSKTEDILKISDLKDMLAKTKEIYKNEIAYKIRIDNGKYKEFSHVEVRDMIDALRDSFN